jgi:FMN-dependent NADH-azoreductase
MSIAASPRGEASHSLAVADAFLSRFRVAHKCVEVDRLDPFTELTPFVARHAEAKMAAIAGDPVPARAAAEWAGVLDVAARVQAADLLLFAVPMWNGGIPWALKLFIDVVTQPGVAFRYDPASGYHGLLGGRRAVTVYVSRVFVPGVGPAYGVDHQSSYLRWWLEFCGISEIHELRLQPTFPTANFERRRADAIADAEQLAVRLAAYEAPVR